MQERHSNRKKYFEEQNIVTSKYVIPYLNQFFPLRSGMTIAEIGCGEAGNLLPFLQMGCKVFGIDIAPAKIENARMFYENHPLKHNLNLLAADIYDIRPDDIDRLDLIIMRDTIEHIPNQELFLKNLKRFLNPGGIIFIAFPPWRMPFGGHQQICESRIVSNIPYLHLLPKAMYVFLLKWAGETPGKVNSLLEIRDTRLSISRFHKMLRVNGFSILRQDYFLINPNYEIKFGLKVRKLPVVLNIPRLRDFVTTACYCVIKPLD